MNGNNNITLLVFDVYTSVSVGTVQWRQVIDIIVNSHISRLKIHKLWVLLSSGIIKIFAKLYFVTLLIEILSIL